MKKLSSYKVFIMHIQLNYIKWDGNHHLKLNGMHKHIPKHPYCRYQLLTRCWENDNTPQPLDQWTNIPFMGQQVGNCKSFTPTNYLANVFAMHCGPRASPLCVQHCIQLKVTTWVQHWLTSFWIHVNPSSKSYERAFLKFDLQNLRSKSQLKLT